MQGWLSPSLFLWEKYDLIDYREDNKWTVYIHIVPKEISGYEWDKYYVGVTSKSTKERWRDGKGYNGQLFGRAIDKYSWDKIKHEIIASNLTQSEASELEKQLIKTLHSNSNKYGYNIQTGGFEGNLLDYPICYTDLTGKVFGKIHITECAGYQCSKTNCRKHIL